VLFWIQLWEKQSIAVKLVLACLISAVLPLTVLSLFSFSVFSKTLENSVRERFENQIMVASAKIENSIEQVGHYLNVVSVNPMVSITFTQYNYELIRDPAFLEEARKNFPDILQIRLLTLDGKEVLSTQPKDTPGGLPSNRVDAELVRELQSSSSEIFIKENPSDPLLKQYAITLAKRTFDIAKNPVGILAIDLDPLPMFKNLKNGIGMETSFGFVLEKSKNPIFLPHQMTGLMWQKNNINKVLHDLSESELQRPTVMEYFETDYGENFTFLVKQLPLFGWVVGISVAKSKIYAELSRFGGLVFIATVIMIGVASGLAVWLSNQFADRLKKLSSAVGTFTKGNYDVPFVESGADEMAELGRVFELMRRRISENTRGLHELIQLRQLQAETEQKRVIETEKRADEEAEKKRLLHFLLESTKGMAAAKTKGEVLKVASQSVLSLLPVTPRTQVNLWYLSSETDQPLKQSYLVRLNRSPDSPESDSLKIVNTSGVTRESWEYIQQKNKNGVETGFLLQNNTLNLTAFWGEKFHGLIEFQGVVPSQFTQIHMDVLKSLLQSMRVCMENIEHTRTYQERLKKETELEAAKTLQQSLFPFALDTPAVSLHGFYQAAQETGGDWYGYYYDAQNHRLEAYIGDVTGHGFASSLLTGVAFGSIYGARTVMESLHAQVDLEAEARLKILAEAANRTILQSAKGEKNMTMAFLSLDLQTGHLLMLNAGHNLPFIVSPINNETGSTDPDSTPSKRSNWKSLTGMGTRLGSKVSPVFNIKSFQLQPGDALFMFSDGLFENTDTDGTGLTLSDLKIAMHSNVKNPKEQCDQVYQLVERLWSNHQLDDDISVLILNWTKPVSRQEMSGQLLKFPFGYWGHTNEEIQGKSA